MVDVSAPRPPLAGDHFDVIVIGGGINGVAIARECALAGRRTLLLEKHDFASGTTSRSTRIIHGGLRYLEHGEFDLVREALGDRERLLRERRHLVRPLAFLLALRGGGRRSALTVRAGLWLYRTLGAERAPASARADIARLSDLLDRGARWTILDYEDAQCEFPERLVAEWLVEATAAGAVALNHCEVLSVLRRDHRVSGVRIRDLLSGNESAIESAHVINATGPWADRVCESSAIRTGSPMIGGVRGAHIVLPRFPGAPGSAVYAEAGDGRPFFVLPWSGQLLVGSTEVPGAPEHAEPSAAEVDYLFSSLLRLFPAVGLRFSDIRCAFAGVRPLPFISGKAPSAITRRHLLHDHAAEGAAGLISLIGGKLTTAPSAARECARMLGVSAPEPAGAAVLARTDQDFDRLFLSWVEELAAGGRLPLATARGMAQWYGPRAATVARLAAADAALRFPLCPHTEHVVAEAVHAVRAEGAITLADILLRRVPVALGACWDKGCGRSAAERIGRALAWGGTRSGAEMEAFEAERAAFLRTPEPLQPEAAGSSGKGQR